MADEITLTIDGRQVTVPKGTLVIEAAKKLGITIPVFCYHTKLAPVGACRQCLVDIEGLPKPQVSCSTQVAEGMVVRTDTPEVKEMWRSVIEFLLVNHPLDCPVCDRGGECPLQDNTFNYGPTDSRFEQEKRHYEKPVPLSSLILLDRERCIQCFRCVRFQKEIPDEPQIQMFSRGYGDYIDIFPGWPFDSNFSGNTIELCPVGALLSSVFRFRARPWEIRKTESVCPNCSVGCNITIDARNSRFVVRYLSREHLDIDDGWLCDQGRFDSTHINSPKHIMNPLIRKNGTLVDATWEEALTAAIDGMKRAGTAACAGLGSSNRTNESNYLFQRFIRLAFGTNNLDYTIKERSPGAERALADGLTSGLFSGSIRDIMKADLIVTLGSDLTFDHPILDLWVRKAIGRNGAKLIFTYPLSAPLANLASSFIRYRSGDESVFATVLASALAGNPPPGVSNATAEKLTEAASISSEAKSITVLVAQSMIEASTDAEAIIDALGLIVDSIKSRGGEASVLLLTDGGNAQGAMDFGLLPGYGPGYQAITEASSALSGTKIIDGARDGSIKALWIMGQDPAADLLNGDNIVSSLAKLNTLVVQDHTLTRTAEMAHVVLPSCTLAEDHGTLTNTERRVQRIMPAIQRVGDSKPDTEIIMLAAFIAGLQGFDFGRIESIFQQMTEEVPFYRDMTYDLLGPKGLQWEAKP